MSTYTPIPLGGQGLTAKLVRQTKIPKPDKHDETKAIDIVAVHGLAPWDSYSDSSFWLRDFIPKDIRGARVFTFYYHANAVWLCEAPLESVQDASRALLTQIAAIREDVPETRPLVLICHGFGGFIVESCLNDAFTHFPNIINCTRGVIFLSTPQRTSQEVPWATLLMRCVSDDIPPGLARVGLSYVGDQGWAESSVVALHDISQGFKAKAKATKKMKLLFCYEDVPTPPQQECSLNAHCAALGLRSEKVELMAGCTHLSMANFLNREDENYKTIITAIKKIRNLALKDTERTSILKLPEPGLHKSVQEIQSPQHIEASQAMTVHILPNTLVAGQQSVNFQNTVTVTHNAPKVTPFSPMPMHASGARALSQGTLPTLQQPAPAYGSIQDASRTSLSTYSATPQFSQFDLSMMMIRRRPVGLPPSRPITTPHSAPGRLEQEIQYPQHPPTKIAPITAPEPKSSVKSGKPDKSGKKPKRSHEAGPLGPANPLSNPGNAAPKPPVVSQFIGNKGMLPASLHIQRPDQGMHHPTLQGIPIGSSQHIAPQPSSTPYQYPPVSHPLPTNHPMDYTTAAMPIQVKPLKKVAKPPKIMSDPPSHNPPKLLGTKSVPQQTRPQMANPGTRPPPIPTTTGGRSIPQNPPTHFPPTPHQGLRELQLQPSYTPPPKNPGLFRRLFSSGRVSQPAPTPTGSRVPSGSQVGLHQPYNPSNPPSRRVSLGAPGVHPGSQACPYPPFNPSIHPSRPASFGGHAVHPGPQGGPSQPPKPTKPIKPAKPTKETKPAKSSKSVSSPPPRPASLGGHAMHPVSQGGPSQPPKPTKPTKPTKETKPAKSSKSVSSPPPRLASLGGHAVHPGPQGGSYPPPKPTKATKSLSSPDPRPTSLGGTGVHPGPQGRPQRPPNPSNPPPRPGSLGGSRGVPGSQGDPYQAYKPPPNAHLPSHGPPRPRQGPPMHGYNPHGHPERWQHPYWQQGNQSGPGHGSYSGPGQPSSNITGNGMMMPMVPVEPVDPGEPTNPTEPTGPVRPVGPGGPAGSGGPINPCEPTGPVKPVDSTEPAGPGAASLLVATGLAAASVLAKPTDPVNSGDLVEGPCEPTGPPAGLVDATGLPKPTDPVKPADPAKPSGLVEPSGPAEPAVPPAGPPIGPVEPTRASEPTGSGGPTVLPADPPIGPVEPTRASEPTGLGDPRGSSAGIPAGPFEPTGPAKPSGLIEPTSPVEPPYAPRSIGPFEHTSPVEPTGRGFTHGENHGQIWQPGYGQDPGHQSQNQSSRSGTIAAGVAGLAVGAGGAALLMSSMNQSDDDDQQNVKVVEDDSGDDDSDEDDADDDSGWGDESDEEGGEHSGVDDSDESGWGDDGDEGGDEVQVTDDSAEEGGEHGSDQEEEVGDEETTDQEEDGDEEDTDQEGWGGEESTDQEEEDEDGSDQDEEDGSKEEDGQEEEEESEEEDGQEEEEESEEDGQEEEDESEEDGQEEEEESEEDGQEEEEESEEDGQEEEEESEEDGQEEEDESEEDGQEEEEESEEDGQEEEDESEEDGQEEEDESEEDDEQDDYAHSYGGDESGGEEYEDYDGDDGEYEYD